MRRSTAHMIPARRPAVTLVEMLGVLAIIGVLVGLSFVMFSSAQKSVDNLQARAKGVRGAKPKAARKAPPLTAPEHEHIVMFKPGTTNPKAHARRLAELCSGTVLYDYYGPFLGCALRIADGNLPTLTADPVVKAVDKNHYFHLHSEIVPTGVRRVASGFLPSMGSGVNTPIHNVKRPGIDNPGQAYVNVAVMDSGIDATHPDLNVVFGKGFGNPDTGDGAGHGTHVAGIIGAIHNDFGVVGVAPGAPLWNIRVLDDNGGGTTADILAALQFVAANADKVRVINMSFGAAAVVPSVNMAVANCVKQGQIVVVSAGNDGKDVKGYSPAGEPSVICVTALSDSDGLPGGLGPNTINVPDPDDTFASYSNFGTLVKVIAPGTDIYSTRPLTPNGSGDIGYGFETGTSMSAPHVSGLAVLALSVQSQPIRNVRFPGGIPPAQPVLTPAAFLQMLFATSKENIPGLFDTRTYPLVCGKGMPMP
jgi:subtilisin family serine protease